MEIFKTDQINKSFVLNYLCLKIRKLDSYGAQLFT